MGFAFVEFESESVAASAVDVGAEDNMDAEVEGPATWAFNVRSRISIPTSASFSVDGGFPC